MSQALHTSSTGINAGQSQINVIAHNVANINTVAFKSANMTFETLYSHNLSHGSAATKDGGGTNPKQIGLGVKVGGITRNFVNGTFVSTGRSLDTMISGSGFYVVQDAGKHSYFTRDGIFNIDSEGNLVTQNGMKVMGAKSVYSNAGSDTTVKIPKNMIANVKGDPDIGDKAIQDLNNASITEGTVMVQVTKTEVTGTDADGNPITQTTTTKTPVTIPSGDKKVSELMSNFDNVEGIKVTNNNDGTYTYSPENSGDTTYTIEFLSEGTTSNFLAESGWRNSTTTKQMSKIASLQDMVNYNNTNAISLIDTAIDENGILIATYSDGSILTQFVDAAQTIQWRYTTPEGVDITGNDVTAEGSSIANSNFALELATMVNQEGLISLNNNLWEWGPDCGEIYYGMAGEMSFGAIESGGYEESNVDIAMELSNMIMAQRMIQMNSRVFSAASEVMQTLTYLGQ